MAKNAKEKDDSRRVRQLDEGDVEGLRELYEHYRDTCTEQGGSPTWSRETSVLVLELLDRLESPEWEYAVLETKIEYGGGKIINDWSPYIDNVQELCASMRKWHEDNYRKPTGYDWYTYKVVGRPKAVPYVELPDANA